MILRRSGDNAPDSQELVRVEASGPGAVAVGGDNYAPITTTVVLPGEGRPGIWLETDRFFALHGGTGLYSHDWTLVGRGQELDALVAWLTGGTVGVAVLDGRGGIGKSRLLRAFAHAAEAEHGYLVRFLDRSVSVKLQDVQALPSADRMLVIVDDAHESPNVANMVAGIRLERPTARILFATRPYGVDQLLKDLRAAGLHRTDVPHWRLDDLSFAKANDLAAAVLGTGHDDDVARRLAAIGGDCPLIIVVGGGLIRQGKLDAHRITNDDLLRDEVMATFANVLTADTTVADPAVRREVLHAIAALQPYRLTEPTFRTAAEALTGKAFDQIVPHLTELENAGIILRRENAVRIVPDLLGDTLLTNAIVDIRSGVGTGYLERILPTVDGDALLHLVFNASRVDWNVRHTAPEPRTSLVDELWETLVARFDRVGLEEKLAWLRRLRPVVFYQSAALLKISQLAWEGSRSDGEPQIRVGIRAALPPVLEKAALDSESTSASGSFSASVDLLWELAGQDKRTDRRQQDHPVQVLQSLAAYRWWKPLVFNDWMVEAAKRWIAASRGSRPAVWPLELLQPLLATEGTEERSDGISLTFKQFQLNRADVAPVRRKVIGLVLDELVSPDPWEAARAAETLKMALQYPHGYFNHLVSVEQREAWTPDFVETLNQLREMVATRPINPLVAIAVRRSLRWHARNASGATKPAARAVLEALPDSIDHEIAAALHGDWSDVLDEMGDLQEAQRVVDEKLDSLAHRTLTTWPDSALVDELARHLQMLHGADLSGHLNPEPFAHALLRNRPSLGQALVAAVISEPRGQLASLLPVTLWEMLRSDADVGWEAVSTLLNRADLTLTRLAADGVSRYRGDRGPVDARERATLHRLLQHEDDATRCMALQAVRWIGKYDRVAAAKLVLSVPFGQSPQVANEVLSAFGKHGYLSYGDIDDADRERLLAGVAGLATIDEYKVQVFLSGLSAVHPQEVIRLLKQRVDAGAGTRTIDYRALPHGWQENLRFREATSSGELLWNTLEWVAEDVDGVGTDDRGALFSAVAVTFDDEVLETLDRAVETGTVQHVRAVGVILAHAPNTFVWNHKEFVTRLIRAAHKHGDRCRREVQYGLERSVRSGGFGGPIGEPFPQDVEQRDRSRAVAATLADGSPERAFYEGLTQRAEAAIRWEIDLDRGLLEHREW